MHHSMSKHPPNGCDHRKIGRYDPYPVALARAPERGARLWIEVTFEPLRRDAWTEAYDRVLDRLDIASRKFR